MRIMKGLVGWLCFFSLVAAPLSVLLWLWAFAWPFLHGATVSRLPEPEPSALCRVIARQGFDAPANQLLEAFVKGTAVPVSVETGFTAALDSAVSINAWFAKVTPRLARGMHSASAAILYDEKSRVVAAYPEGLSHIQITTVPPTSFVRQFAPQADAPTGHDILDANGKAIGALWVYDNGDRMVENISPEQKTPRWLAGLSGFKSDLDMSMALVRGIVFMVMFGLLLPIWVGLDASWRGMRPFAWGTLVFLTSIIGFLAYLVARLPSPRSCSNCGERVLGKYVRCPVCGVDFLQRCPQCGRRMKPGWQFCPLCKNPDEGQENKAVPSNTFLQSPIAPSMRESSTGILDVIVTDDSTGLPLRGVCIAVHGPSELSGVTNGHGVFTMHRLSDGEYDIGVSRNGYAAEQRTIEVMGTQHERLSISLKPLPGKVVGRIADCSTGLAVPQASVYLDTSRVDRSTTTGDDGTYVLDNLMQGDYTLVIEAKGYATHTRLVEIQPGQSVVADLGLTPTEDGAAYLIEEEMTDVMS